MLMPPTLYYFHMTLIFPKYHILLLHLHTYRYIQHIIYRISLVAFIMSFTRIGFSLLLIHTCHIVAADVIYIVSSYSYYAIATFAVTLYHTLINNIAVYIVTIVLILLLFFIHYATPLRIRVTLQVSHRFTPHHVRTKVSLSRICCRHLSPRSRNAPVITTPRRLYINAMFTIIRTLPSLH